MTSDPSTKVIPTEGGAITVSYVYREGSPSTLTIRFRNHIHIVEDPDPVVNLQWLQPILEEHIYAPTAREIVTDLQAVVREIIEQAEANRETMHMLGAAAIEDMMKTDRPSHVYPPVDEP